MRTQRLLKWFRSPRLTRQYGDGSSCTISFSWIDEFSLEIIHMPEYTNLNHPGGVHGLCLTVTAISLNPSLTTPRPIRPSNLGVMLVGPE